MEYEDDGDTSSCWNPWNSLQESEKKTKWTGGQMKDRDCPVPNTAKIS